MKKVFISLILSVLWSSIFGQTPVKTDIIYFGQSNSGKTKEVKDSQGKIITIPDCDAYSSSNPKYPGGWIQTHPVASSTSSNTELSTSGTWGQGIMLKYDFKYRHLYKIELNGKTLNGGSSVLEISFANGLTEYDNTDCRQYSSPSLPTSFQKIYDGEPDWIFPYNKLNILNSGFIRANNTYEQLWIRTVARGQNSTYSLSMLTITDYGDPYEISNNNITINPGGVSPTTDYEIVGQSISNLLISGSLPTGGGTPDKPIPDEYYYEWEISENGGPYKYIPNSNTQSYTLSTSKDNVKIRRKVYTKYYGNRSSNEVVINILSCKRQTAAVQDNNDVGQICDNQYLYNVLPGQNVQFRSIIGSTYYPKAKDRPWKYVYYISNENGVFVKNFQNNLEPGDRRPHEGDLNTSKLNFTKSNEIGKTEIFYVIRKTEEYYRDWGSSIFTNEWYTKEVGSNIVKLLLSPCNNPDALPISISGPNIISCGIKTLTYNLNLDLCGVTNITWRYPTGWLAKTPVSGATQTSFTADTYPIDPNKTTFPGGNIVAIISFADGKQRTISYPLTAKATPINITTSSANTDVKLCLGKDFVLNANWAGGTPPYTIPSGLNPQLDPSLQLIFNQTISIANKTLNLTVPYKQRAMVPYAYNFAVKDAEGCVTTIKYNITAGSDWYQEQPYIGNNTHIPAVSKDSKLEFDAKGNLYYIGITDNGTNKALCSYYWGSGAWVNFEFPKASKNAPVKSTLLGEALKIVTHADGNRSIFYSENNVIYYIKSTVANMNESNPTAANWSNKTKFVEIGQPGDLKAFYPDLTNNIGIGIINNTLYKNTITLDAAQGNSLEVANNIVYYVKNGSLTARNYLTNNSITLTGALDTRPGSTLQYVNGYLYFVGANGDVRRLNTTNYVVESFSNSFRGQLGFAVSAEKNIYINPVTETVYFTSDGGDFFQMFKSGSSLGTSPIKNMETPHSSAVGSIKYASPNQFFIGNGNLVHFNHYFTSACDQAVQRVDNSNATHTEETLQIYPNPAISEITIKGGALTVGQANITATDVLGNTLQLANYQLDTTGEIDVNVPVTSLPAGLYLIQLTQHGKVVAKQKFLKQ